MGGSFGKFWRWMVVMYNHVNVLNATELCN